jgi:hypothetical protein
MGKTTEELSQEQGEQVPQETPVATSEKPEQAVTTEQPKGE